MILYATTMSTQILSSIPLSTLMYSVIWSLETTFLSNNTYVSSGHIIITMFIWGIDNIHTARPYYNCNTFTCHNLSLDTIEGVTITYNTPWNSVSVFIFLDHIYTDCIQGYILSSFILLEYKFLSFCHMYLITMCPYLNPALDKAPFTLGTCLSLYQHT